VYFFGIPEDVDDKTAITVIIVRTYYCSDVKLEGNKDISPLKQVGNLQFDAFPIRR
jgi:hypothetical protein